LIKNSKFEIYLRMASRNKQTMTIAARFKGILQE